MKQLKNRLKKSLSQEAIWYVFIIVTVWAVWAKNNFYLNALSEVSGDDAIHSIDDPKKLTKKTRKKNDQKVDFVKEEPKILTPEQQQALAQLQQKRATTVLFSPDDNVYDLLLALIDQEQEKINIAIFTFTDTIVVQALQKAHERGVIINIITDRSCVLDRYNKIDELYNMGIPIYVYNPAYNNKKVGIMHHKFIIFTKNVNNRSIVWTGSYNLTKSARWHNQENVVVFNRKAVVKRFVNQFIQLLKRADNYRPPFYKSE